QMPATVHKLVECKTLRAEKRTLNDPVLEMHNLVREAGHTFRKFHRDNKEGPINKERAEKQCKGERRRAMEIVEKVEAPCNNPKYGDPSTKENIDDRQIRSAKLGQFV